MVQSFDLGSTLRRQGRPRKGPNPGQPLLFDENGSCHPAATVAIEAAHLAYPGTVYAIEQEVADYHLIVANAQTFGVGNLARGTEQLETLRFEAVNPTFLLSVRKPAK